MAFLTSLLVSFGEKSHMLMYILKVSNLFEMVAVHICLCLSTAYLATGCNRTWAFPRMPDCLSQNNSSFMVVWKPKLKLTPALINTEKT